MKKILAILLSLIICFTFVGCQTEEEQKTAHIESLNAEIARLESDVNNLKVTKNELENQITDIKIENGTAKYVLTINIKQVHYSLDFSEHFKDSMNDLSIQIPVDKEYYDSVSVGDVIDDSFRVGSAIFKGSFGSWKVTVEAKEIR